MRWFAPVVLFAVANLAQFGPVIVSPRPGETLQGAVVISGTSNASNFVSYEMEFAYAGAPAGTWFLISQSYEPVRDGTLAVWDTTVITDGDYDLRLRIHLVDGATLDMLVPNVRIRNYTLVETITPDPAASTEPPTLAVITPSIPLPTSTLLPINPAALTPFRIYKGLGYGALAAISLLLVFMLIIRLRRN